MLAVTRELKLALIVGFFLVLLVSFLIADHLSASRKVELEPKIAQSQPPMMQAVPGMTGQGTGSPQDPMQSTPVVSFMQGANGGVTTNPTLETRPIGQDPSVVEQIGSRVGSVITGETRLPPAMGTDMIGTSGVGSLGLSQNQMPGIDTLGARGVGSNTTQPATVESSRIASGSTTTGETGFNPVTIARPNTLSGEMQPTGGNASLPIDVGVKTEVKPVINPIPERKPEVKVEEDRTHTIVSGDSLYAIAKRYYGDGEAWRELAKYNGDRVGKNGTLRLGVKIKLPAAEKIGIKSAKAMPKADAKQEAKPEVKPSKTTVPEIRPSKPGDTRLADNKPASSGKTYTVKKGDTLSEISMKELGTMKRASEIVKLNNLKDAGDIRIGMTLKMPK